MQSTSWTEEHSEALRKLLESGMSFSRTADSINEKFKTTYSRCAVIGRAKRMALAGPERPESAPPINAPRMDKPRQRPSSDIWRPLPVFKIEKLNLRCVEIDPRHLSLLDLEPGDCRYPYGGDEEGEAITFCGHPRRLGTSYCAAHFDLTCGPAAETGGPGTASKRIAGTVSLRLVEAA